MEISAGLRGALLKPRQVEIDWRHMMNYAAALNDPNPAYFDDLDPGGIIAHPMYAVAVTWPVIQNIGQYLDSEELDTNLLATQVHYTEHLAFHRPMEDGDRLTISGRVAAMLPHRAGTHLVIRLEAGDAQGRPVFTEHMGGLLRGVALTGEPGGGDGLPPHPTGPDPGDALWENFIPISPVMPHVYDGCSDIYFPIHTSLRFARFVGLPGIILQGTATLALAVRDVIDREAGGDPRRLRSVACRFTGMVPPGTDIRVRALGRQYSPQGEGIFFEVLNHKGEKAISGGYAVLGGGGE